MRLAHNAIAVVLHAALLMPVGATAQVAFGPLASQEAGPLQRVGLSHTAESADLVAHRVLEVGMAASYSNIFEEDSTATHRLFMDLERLSTDVGVRWGAAPRLELGGRLSFETTGGGILDGFISGWHKRIGTPNANRGKYPFDVYAQRLTDSLGNVRLDVPQRTMALEDVRLFLKWRAWESADGRQLVSLSGLARVPTQDNGVGPRRTDASLTALARMSWTRWHLHAALGGATVRAAQDYDGLLRSSAFFADVALERSFSPSVSGVAQVSLESPRLQGFDNPELDGWPVNLVFGLNGQIAEHWRMDVSFQEDIPARTPAADFTLTIGLRRSWGR
jgi:hypothetical protein